MYIENTSIKITYLLFEQAERGKYINVITEKYKIEKKTI